MRNSKRTRMAQDDERVKEDEKGKKERKKDGYFGVEFNIGE